MSSTKMLNSSAFDIDFEEGSLSIVDDLVVFNGDGDVNVNVNGEGDGDGDGDGDDDAHPRADVVMGTPEDSTVHVDSSNFEKLMNMNGSQYFYVPNWINSPSNVTIIMDNSRKDRMGQQLSRIISVSAYAHCMQYNFCVWSKAKQSHADELGIPVCPDQSGKEWHQHNKLLVDTMDLTQRLPPGFYHLKTRNFGTNLAGENFAKCKSSNQFREFWRNNILAAPLRGALRNSLTAKENLFSKNKTVVAIHIRRGDITIQQRRDLFIKDTVFIQIIQQLRAMIEARFNEGLREPEVHVFSEDYGTVNWTSYEGLVDMFHLAPKMSETPRFSMRWDLNIRDWIHFIKADITVTSGSSFSGVPAFLKADPDPMTGLPFAIRPCIIAGIYGGCNNAQALLSTQDQAQATYTSFTDRIDPNTNDTVVVLKGLPIVWSKSHSELLLHPTSDSNSSSAETLGTAFKFNFTVLPYMDSEKERAYIQKIHALPPVPSDKKYVISYGIYGDNPKYITGAIRNVELAPTYFPGWEIRFYYDDTVPSDAIQKLKDLGANLIFRPDDFKDGGSVGMIWRFLVADDESVDRFLCRDSDSRLNARDRFAVEEWIQSDKAVHMVRDHPNHPYAMNGGSWGGTKGCLKGETMSALAKDYLHGRDIVEWGTDIGFLNKRVLPLVKESTTEAFYDGIMSHDAFFCWKYGGNGYPTKRDDNLQFVGQVFDKNDQPVKSHFKKLLNGNHEECRPKDHKDWTFG